MKILKKLLSIQASQLRAVESRGPCVRKLFTGLIMYLPSQNKEHCIVLYCIVLMLPYQSPIFTNIYYFSAKLMLLAIEQLVIKTCQPNGLLHQPQPITQHFCCALFHPWRPRDSQLGQRKKAANVPWTLSSVLEILRHLISRPN